MDEGWTVHMGGKVGKIGKVLATGITVFGEMHFFTDALIRRHRASSNVLVHAPSSPVRCVHLLVFRRTGQRLGDAPYPKLSGYSTSEGIYEVQ
jgi:hypothetical protein